MTAPILSGQVCNHAQREGIVPATMTLEQAEEPSRTFPPDAASCALRAAWSRASRTTRTASAAASSPEERHQRRRGGSGGEQNSHMNARSHPLP